MSTPHNVAALRLASPTLNAIAAMAYRRWFEGARRMRIVVIMDTGIA
ncbi:MULTISPECIES: hypothetical protein [Rhizobium]|nr:MULTISPECIES: hypothetical protein [Rhizobium]